MARKNTQERQSDLNSFAERLRGIMKEKHISQQDLAKGLDVTPQAVSLYATGRAAVDITTLKKLSGLLNVTTDYLFGLVPNRENSFIANDEISKYTGLSLDAVETLREAKGTRESEYKCKLIDRLIQMIGNNPILLDRGQYWLTINSTISDGEIESFKTRIEPSQGAENSLRHLGFYADEKGRIQLNFGEEYNGKHNS